MTERIIQASTFKARCLSLLDEVEQDHTVLVVTKHGRPVAKLVPIQTEGTAASVTLLSEDDESYFGTGELWTASD